MPFDGRNTSHRLFTQSVTRKAVFWIVSGPFCWFGGVWDDALWPKFPGEQSMLQQSKLLGSWQPGGYLWFCCEIGRPQVCHWLRLSCSSLALPPWPITRLPQVKIHKKSFSEAEVNFLKDEDWSTNLTVMDDHQHSCIFWLHLISHFPLVVIILIGNQMRAGKQWWHDSGLSK